DRARGRTGLSSTISESSSLLRSLSLRSIAFLCHPSPSRGGRADQVLFLRADDPPQRRGFAAAGVRPAHREGSRRATSVHRARGRASKISNDGEPCYAIKNLLRGLSGS